MLARFNCCGGIHMVKYKLLFENTENYCKITLKIENLKIALEPFYYEPPTSVDSAAAICLARFAIGAESHGASLTARQQINIRNKLKEAFIAQSKVYEAKKVSHIQKSNTPSIGQTQSQPNQTSGTLAVQWKTTKTDNSKTGYEENVSTEPVALTSQIAYQTTRQNVRPEFSFAEKSRYTASGQNLISKILQNSCAFYIAPVDRCIERIAQGSTTLIPAKDGIPKYLNFIDSRKNKYFCKIDRIHVISYDDIDNLPKLSISQIGVAFKSAPLSRIIIFSLNDFRPDTHSNCWIYYVSDTCDLLNAVDNSGYNTSICMYDLDRCALKFESDSLLLNDLKPALTYYRYQLNKLFTRENQLQLQIAVPLLREFYQEFRNLSTEETQFVLPVKLIKGRISKTDSISLLISQDAGDSYKLDFYDCLVVALSKNELKEYMQALSSVGITLGEYTLCLIDTADMGEREVYRFSQTILDEQLVECVLTNNIEGERARLKRIISGIEQVLNNKVINQNLVYKICTNNIENDIPNMLTKQAYIPDARKIEALKRDYPVLADNREQLMAVDKILQMQQNNIDFMLVQGPPGTGKTELILALAKELSKEKCNTLITSNVHVACDNVVDRLKNNKDIVLKRFTSSRGEQYEKEIIENKQKYIENQVLAGYQFDGKSINSKTAYDFIVSQKKFLEKEKQELLKQKQVYDDSLRKYYDLLEQKETLNLSLKNYSDSIYRGLYILMIQIFKVRSLQLSINEAQKAFNDAKALLMQQKLEVDSMGQKEQSIMIDIRTINESNDKIDRTIIEKLVPKKEYCQQLLQALSIDKSRLDSDKVFLDSCNYENIVQHVVDCVSSSSPLDYRYNELLKECIKDIATLSDLYSKLCADQAFWREGSHISMSTLEYIYFKLQQDCNIFNIIGDLPSLTQIEDIYEYYKTSSAKKSLMGVLPLFKLNNKSQKHYESLSRQLDKSLKKVQFSLDAVVRRIIDIWFSSGALQSMQLDNSKKIDDNRNQISSLLEAVKSIDQRIELLEKERSDNRLHSTDLANDLFDLKEELRDKRAILSDCQNETEKRKYECELLNSSMNNQLRAICALNNNIFDLKVAKKNTEALLGNLERFIVDEYNEKKLLLDDYENFSNKIKFSIDKISQRIYQISQSILGIENRVTKMVANGWHPDAAYKFLFEYISELDDISNCSDSRQLNNFFNGRGTAFDKLFWITDTTEGSLISMTTNQIASLLKEAKELTFDYAIVDEASKCSFEDLIVSLPRVKHLVLIGDFMQLDPMYSPFENIDITYQNIFTPNSWDALNRSQFSLLLQKIVEYNRQYKITNFDSYPCVSVLKRQYRMNKGIYNIIEPIYSIYSGFELIDEKQTTANDVMCVQIDGNEMEVGAKHSYQNIQEANAIVAFLTQFQNCREKYSHIKKIGIITGYRAQEKYIRNSLKKGSKIPGIQIGTFDRFQGREYDMVLVSLVRTQKFGFTSDIRRMNVAFSRAKNHLIVFGNFEVLNRIATRSSIIYKQEHIDVTGRESNFVTKTLIPQLFAMKTTFVSEKERTAGILNFIKEVKA